MTTVNGNAFLIDAGIDVDDDLCEICYSNKIDTDLACTTCSKSTCISCCNLFKSRSYEYIAKDKCSYNDLQNEMTIQYDCPHCRGNNSKSICDFKDKNVILKAFDRNTNDISLKDIEQSTQTNENIYKLDTELRHLQVRKCEDYNEHEERYIKLSKGLLFKKQDFVEDFEEGTYHKNLRKVWNSFTENERIVLVYKQSELKEDAEISLELLVKSHETNIKLIKQIDDIEKKLAFNNLIPYERYDTDLINERKKNKELTEKYNRLSGKYNILTKQFVAMSNGSSEIIDNISVAINNVKRSSKKQTINIIKKYLQNIVSLTVNIQEV